MNSEGTVGASRRALTAVIAAACVIGLISLARADLASAGTEWKWYSFEHNTCSPTERVDPIGMVFLGLHGDAPFADHEVQDRLHETYKNTFWPGDSWAHGQPDQFIYRKSGAGAGTGVCLPLTQSMANRADSLPPPTRFHMRVGTLYSEPILPNQGSHPFRDPGQNMAWSLGTPHFELTPNHCIPANNSSVGSGFDFARRLFKSGLKNNSGPTSFVQIKGTSIGQTELRKSCSGEASVSGNGGVVWVRIGDIENTALCCSIGPYTP